MNLKYSTKWFQIIIRRNKIMMNEFDIEKIKQFIMNNADSRVYLGVDSEKTKKKKVRFAVVVIIHYNNKNGAKIFAKVDYESIIDAKLSRPFNRMMAEVQRVTDLFTELEDVLIDRDFEIHLDINPDARHGSNVAYGAAKGMIQGIVGVMPICKPFSFAASLIYIYIKKIR